MALYFPEIKEKIAYLLKVKKKNAKHHSPLFPTSYRRGLF